MHGIFSMRFLYTKWKLENFIAVKNNIPGTNMNKWWSFRNPISRQIRRGSSTTTKDLLVPVSIPRNEDQQSLALATSGICELVAIQPITNSAYLHLHSITIVVVTGGQWYAHLLGEYDTCGKPLRYFCLEETKRVLTPDCTGRLLLHTEESLWAHVTRQCQHWANPTYNQISLLRIGAFAKMQYNVTFLCPAVITAGLLVPSFMSSIN